MLIPLSEVPRVEDAIEVYDGVDDGLLVQDHEVAESGAWPCLTKRRGIYGTD